MSGQQPRSPEPQRQLGNALVFIGLFLLLTALITLLYVGWDIRAGGHLVIIAFLAQVVAALVLLLAGYSRRKRGRT